MENGAGFKDYVPTVSEVTISISGYTAEVELFVDFP